MRAVTNTRVRGGGPELASPQLRTRKMVAVWVSSQRHAYEGDLNSVMVLDADPGYTVTTMTWMAGSQQYFSVYVSGDTARGVVNALEGKSESQGQRGRVRD